jgi:hypothetical protein
VGPGQVEHDQDEFLDAREPESSAGAEGERDQDEFLDAREPESSAGAEGEHDQDEFLDAREPESLAGAEEEFWEVGEVSVSVVWGAQSSPFADGFRPVSCGNEEDKDEVGEEEEEEEAGEWDVE